jgi:cytochrome c-type biogenesis protein CcmH/NrfG
MAMTSHRASDPNEAVARLERELLTRLGLGTGASNDQLEAAHDEVVRYLEAAPAALRAWAAAQVDAADEAYALLRGPRADLFEVAGGGARGSGSGTVRTRLSAEIVSAAGNAPVAGPVSDALGGDRVVTASPASEGRRSASRRSLLIGSEAGAADARGRTVRRAVFGALAMVAVVAVAVVVYNLGAPAVPGFTGTPAPDASSAVDPAQVSALMQKLSADPADVTTMRSLGDLYYTAGDYATAAIWMERILQVDDQNVDALLALGAAQFNVGSTADAETEWRKVLAIDPKNVEAHYDLGFMYLSENPPDIVQVKAEWNEVIALAPDSDVAKTVATHLQSLDGTAAPSASTSAAPASSGAAPEASATPEASVPSDASAPSSSDPGPTPGPSPSGGGS